jgi:hypothetical protein
MEQNEASRRIHAQAASLARVIWAGTECRLAIHVLAKRRDALAAVFGAGLHQDTVEATCDDAPLRERGITRRSASDFLREQAGALDSCQET